MADRFETILLFGAPGVGKGTQGRILGAIPGFHHCACGDVFRSIDMQSELGRIFHAHSTRGELVPDEVTVKIWRQAIQGRSATSTYRPGRDLLVLDGIPRTVEQARLMDGLITVLKVIHLVCTEPEAMFERLRRRALKENRADDADEKVIRNRWSVYEAETAPVLGHYPGSLVADVDSIGSPAQVLRRVLAVLEPIEARHFARLNA